MGLTEFITVVIAAGGLALSIVNTYLLLLRKPVLLQKWYHHPNYNIDTWEFTIYNKSRKELYISGIFLEYRRKGKRRIYQLFLLGDDGNTMVDGFELPQIIAIGDNKLKTLTLFKDKSSIRDKKRFWLYHNRRSIVTIASLDGKKWRYNYPLNV